MVSPLTKWVSLGSIVIVVIVGDEWKKDVETEKMKELKSKIVVRKYI